MGAEINTLTIIWDLITFSAMVVFLVLATDARGNLKALKSRGMNGSARHVCGMDFRLDLLISIAMFFLFLMGAIITITTFRGNPPYSPLETWAIAHVSVVFRYCLISSVVVICVAGFDRKFARVKLIEILSNEHMSHADALVESRSAGFEEGMHDGEPKRSI